MQALSGKNKKKKHYEPQRGDAKKDGNLQGFNICSHNFNIINYEDDYLDNNHRKITKETPRQESKWNREKMINCLLQKSWQEETVSKRRNEFV